MIFKDYNDIQQVGFQQRDNSSIGYFNFSKRINELFK